MTRRLALVALLALAACGGDDKPDPTPWQRPVVDPARLGVACPAPEVPVQIADALPGQCAPDRTTLRDVPAGDVQPGQWLIASGENLITEVVTIDGAQRLRLVMDDGREGLFTADHGFYVFASDAMVYFWPLYQLRPGDRLLLPYLTDGGRVADVQTAPDGPVVQIKAVEDVAHPCYTGAGLDMITMGLASLIHTERTLPTQRPAGL